MVRRGKVSESRINLTVSETSDRDRLCVSSVPHLSIRGFLEKLSKSGPDCHAWNRFLASIPFAAFYWEMPPMTVTSADNEFDCMLINAPLLVRPENPICFAEYFSTSDSAVRFPNLGRDALLVVPTPRTGNTDSKNFSHLGSFCRTAGPDQVAALWALVAKTTLENLRGSRSTRRSRPP